MRCRVAFRPPRPIPPSQPRVPTDVATASLPSDESPRTATRCLACANRSRGTQSSDPRRRSQPEWRPSVVQPTSIPGHVAGKADDLTDQLRGEPHQLVGRVVARIAETSFARGPGEDARIQPESRTITSQVHDHARFADDSANMELDRGGGQAGAAVALMDSGHPLVAPRSCSKSTSISAHSPRSLETKPSVIEGNRSPSNWQGTGIVGP